MPDVWFYGILNFLKDVCGSSNFRKIRAIILKLDTNILYRWKNLGIKFGQNLTCANFELSKWNFVLECINVSYAIWWESVETFQFYTDLNFLIFFYTDIKFKKFDVSRKLPLWGSQNQATYFLKERKLWNQWGTNMGIPIHMRFPFKE